MLSIAFVIQNPIFMQTVLRNAVVLAAKHRFWQPNTLTGGVYTKI
jgi:hypothetical protein